MGPESLQDRYFSHGTCFGCGPANAKGLRIKSLVRGEEIAAHHLMLRAGAEHPPCTVTAEFHVKLLRPTPSGEGPISLRARAVESSRTRAVVEATLEAGGEPCATCRGVFIAVKPGHPAYNRW